MEAEQSSECNLGWEIEVNDGSRYKKLGALVKRMKCTSNREKRDFENSQPIRIDEPKVDAWRLRFETRKDIEPEEEEPKVMITIHEGDMTYPPVYHSPINPKQTNKSKPKIRELQTKISTQTVESQKKLSDMLQPYRIHTNYSNEPEPAIQQANRVQINEANNVEEVYLPFPEFPNKTWKSMVAPTYGSGDTRRPNHWKGDPDIPSLILDDEEESTALDDVSYSVVTGLDTVTTGYTSATGFSTVATGFTTVATEYSNDSGGSFVQTKPTRLSDSRQKPRHGTTKRVSKSKQKNLQNKKVLSGVAEDLGIVVGFILTDGSELFNCMAETTRETVSSCRTA